MKRFLKVLKWIGAGLLLLIVGFVLFVQLTWDKAFDAPYPNIKASTDPAVIARGAYLANGPMHCGGCHADNEEVLKYYDGQDVELKGGWELELPGFATVRTSNITSDQETGLGKLSDGEIARTLRYGVGSDGRAIFPMMAFQGLSDEDLTAVLSYLRTLPPLHHEVQPVEYSFMAKVLFALGVFKPDGPKSVPPQSIQKAPTIEYGKYLAYSVGNCRNCHTEFDKQTGEYIGKDFAGKASFDPDAITRGYAFVSPNLTPDEETGIMAKWTEEAFIHRFKQGRVHEGSPMPWAAFSRMDTVDLQALYRFLHSLEPVRNKVEQIVFLPGEKRNEQ